MRVDLNITGRLLVYSNLTFINSIMDIYSEMLEDLTQKKVEMIAELRNKPKDAES